MTETRLDEYEPILDIIRTNLLELGLPLRTLEVEFGPSQVEITFKPTLGLEAADNMMLFQTIQQVSPLVLVSIFAIRLLYCYLFSLEFP